MKKLISIFLICIYLVSFTEAKEILKLPAFVEHFNEHKSENKNITVFKFIVMHYLSGSKKDKDYQEDMKLPFKTHDFSSFAFITFDIPKTLNLEITQPKNISNQKKVTYHHVLGFIIDNYQSIFQPPEIA